MVAYTSSLPCSDKPTFSHLAPRPSHSTFLFRGFFQLLVPSTGLPPSYSQLPQAVEPRLAPSHQGLGWHGVVGEVALTFRHPILPCNCLSLVVAFLMTSGDLLIHLGSVVSCLISRWSVPSEKAHVRVYGSCGSMGWALSCKAKGLLFDSQSEHIPGFQVRPLDGVCARSN